MRNQEEREQRQKKLAKLFFEMGMDLDLIEKISGISKESISFMGLNKTDDLSLTLNDSNSNIYIENKNSY